MLNKLKNLQQTIYSAKWVVDKLESGTEELRTGFETAMGLQKINHTAVDYKGGKSGMQWRTNIGVEDNHVSYRLKAEWKQNFKRAGLFNDGATVKINESGIANAVTIWASWKRGIAKTIRQNDNRVPTELYQELVSKLGVIGIKASIPGIKEFMTSTGYRKLNADKNRLLENFITTVSYTHLTLPTTPYV